MSTGEGGGGVKEVRRGGIKREGNRHATRLIVP